MTRWHKRVPAGMVAEYIALGWTVEKREGRIVTLVWPKDGTPE